MTDQEFRALVSQMRQAQREFFASKHPKHLNEAKRLEKEVDTYLSGQLEIKPAVNQTKLF